ncbi:hypothetical protein AM500_04470 [Bacillus sp. FJAT-18017]|uniref:hypothetical protein n=1 Tax=Bacillus sp. FJAT-18017 TaxID=1705566 RepID=UPI0006AE993D|nr:hypothetical protein [Bacillus sp. FJAT-18017]ALC89127.1 hypothetical protein AM500_04470 [Bacillus sp. FJAT-18017]
MKKVMIFFLAALVLVGCSGKGKNAEQHGKGISVEMAASTNIKHLSLVQFVNGKEIASENVVNADGSAFQKGENTWFDIPIGTGKPVELALVYSLNHDGTNAKTSQRVEISKASRWVNLKLNDDYQLELINAE